MEIKLHDYVDVTYRSSVLYGKVTKVDTKHSEAVVTFAPGVSMLLPMSSMVAVSERVEEE